MDMATLHLEDGSSYRGHLFGSAVSVPGEVGKMFTWCLMLALTRVIDFVKSLNVFHALSVSLSV